MPFPHATELDDLDLADAMSEDDDLNPILPPEELERLDQVVVRQLDRYFEQLNGAHPHPLHPLVMNAVEKTLLIYAMERCEQNQCKAASLLGINRNTLHKKLATYDLLPGDSFLKRK